ncbi:cyclic nucleotide-binding domain-containing protein [Hymenobacter nivis]|nr:cyclic nucleotide-binding domain-containing protein [Hymenobacter nivis]
MERWHRFLGVRPGEMKAVGLFAAHNFLLGTGTILVYVAATVLLLAHDPARTLPLAYGAGALAALAVGRLYARAEHHWALQRLAGRALAAAAVLVLVLGALLRWGPSVGAAVAIMAGYRLIYLLTSLEFWGMSAVVFNVRQGRRLFGVISAGDLPAKALGAGLAVFVHAQHALYGLLLTAFGAYLLALLVQRATFRAQAAARPGPPAAHGAPAAGGQALVRALGLSLLALAAAAVGVEYLFLVNVKYKFQGQGPVLQYVGGVLVLTYLLATGLKLLFARRGLDWLGVRRALLVLPLAALAGIGLFGVLWAAQAGPGAQLAYFCGLYLGLEVLRRAVFEPVFLVLFQPLSPPARLAGHTQAKGVYEPLGLALGALLLALPRAAALGQWLPLAWMAALLLGALVLLRRAYGQYLNELRGALGLRFGTPAEAAGAPREPAGAPGGPVPAAATDAAEATAAAEAADAPASAAALQALAHLQYAGPAALAPHAEALLGHPDGRVRARALALLGPRADVALLCRRALADPDPALRELAARLAGPHPAADALLGHPDWPARQGALRGRLEAAPADALARASLAALAADAAPAARLACLALAGFLEPGPQAEAVAAGLRGPNPALVQAAVRAAAAAPTPAVLAQLVALLHTKAVQPLAAAALAGAGAAALPVLGDVLARETDGRRLQRVAQACAHQGTPAARQLLVATAQGPHLPGRAAALRALTAFASDGADAPGFQRLVEEELRFAQHLLHGMAAADAELRAALRYELRKGQQRLFGALAQLYERQPILDAQRGAAHTAGERQANALEMLDNLLPRPLYQGLQAMLDAGRLRDKVLVFNDLLGPLVAPEALPALVVRRGLGAFSAWTVGVALRRWHPQPATVAHLYPHLLAEGLLVQESARALLRQLPVLRPAAYDVLLTEFPGAAALLMAPSSDHSPACASALERVRLLKGTALFAQTPENVLAAIEPIMREMAFAPGQEIFAKGSLGTSLFIVCTGEVGIFDGLRPLATFSPGDFFGELALLDAEARSASAVAQGPVAAFRIDQEDFYDVMEECAEVGRNVLRVLCQRLRRQNEKMPPVVA